MKVLRPRLESISLWAFVKKKSLPLSAENGFLTVNFAILKARTRSIGIYFCFYSSEPTFSPVFNICRGKNQQPFTRMANTSTPLIGLSQYQQFSCPLSSIFRAKLDLPAVFNSLFSPHFTSSSSSFPCCLAVKLLWLDSYTQNEQVDKSYWSLFSSPFSYILLLLPITCRCCCCCSRCCCCCCCCRCCSRCCCCCWCCCCCCHYSAAIAERLRTNE